MIIKFAAFLFLNFANILLNSQVLNEKDNSEYVNVLKTGGSSPIDFLNQKAALYDLIIFDDALHLANEPFDFYRKIEGDSLFNSKVKYLFIEVFSINSQPYVDKYLNNPVKDSSILFKVFQDDFTGYGLRYKTYFDLFSTVWDVNKKFANAEDKIKIICVDMPINWCSINSKQDYELFQSTLDARDYFMYKKILGELSGFKKGKKGIFLTNTRHAYKNIRNSEGELYWNCGTFFTQMNPGKTYSIRLHNVTLAFISKTKTSERSSIEGLKEFDYKWIRMENGLWDNAFKEYGNKPVAFSITDNVFGSTKYVGNHMLNVLSGQMMQDAYDAVIFLAPLENLHFTAMVDWIYTPDFKKELERRIIAVNDGNIEAILKDSDSGNLDEHINKYMKFKEQQKNYFVEPANDGD